MESEFVPGTVVKEMDGRRPRTELRGNVVTTWSCGGRGEKPSFRGWANEGEIGEVGDWGVSIL